MSYKILKYNIILIITLFLTLSFDVLSPRQFFVRQDDGIAKLMKYSAPPSIAEIESIEERLVVKFVPSHNVVTADDSSKTSFLNLLMLEPMKGLDFREHTSMYLKVEQDDVVVMDTTISSFIPRKQRRKVKSAIINRKFEDYKKLVISVYDRSKKLNYHVDALIYVK